MIIIDFDADVDADLDYDLFLFIDLDDDFYDFGIDYVYNFNGDCWFDNVDIYYYGNDDVDVDFDYINDDIDDLINIIHNGIFFNNDVDSCFSDTHRVAISNKYVVYFFFNDYFTFKYTVDVDLTINNIYKFNRYFHNANDLNLTTISN